MALALLEVATSARVAADTRVIDAAQWRVIAGAADLRERAAAAVLRAQENARESVMVEMRQRADQLEHEMNKALLLKTLSMQAEHERALREIRATFVDTVVECVRALLSPPPAGFFARVHESATAMLGSQPELVFHVSARDEPAARIALADAVDSGSLRLVVDPELAAGQCFLETRFGRIQASVRTQLEVLREALARWWPTERDKVAPRASTEHGA